MTVSANEVADRYRDEVRRAVAALPKPPKLVGLLSQTAGEPSRIYADYTRRGCEDVGISFELVTCPRLQLESTLREANEDPSVHGIMIYYPVFGTEQDTTLRNMLRPEKDVEGLNQSWISMLYENIRTVGVNKRAILPCTPLAILKILAANGYGGRGDEGQQPLAGITVTVFNRSEVVGRPLAAMLANDGARVFSFDIDDPILFTPEGAEDSQISRAEALAQSKIIITGVPSRSFPLVQASEIQAGAVCINFSSIRNFENDVKDKASIYIKQVGRVTVSMCLRNTLRLYIDFHSDAPSRESRRLIPPQC